jgi:glucosamine--fructose-6-phosphate aminotransferase (isomerizing)
MPLVSLNMARPLALVDKAICLVVVLAPKDMFEAKANMQEVHARHGELSVFLASEASQMVAEDRLYRIYKIRCQKRFAPFTAPVHNCCRTISCRDASGNRSISA